MRDTLATFHLVIGVNETELTVPFGSIPDSRSASVSHAGDSSLKLAGTWRPVKTQTAYDRLVQWSRRHRRHREHQVELRVEKGALQNGPTIGTHGLGFHPRQQADTT